MRRLAALSVICLAALSAITMTTARAQDADPTPAPVIIDDVDSPVGDIIPQPNSGVPPANPGDRGGALQLILLALIIAFMAVGFFSVRRSMKRARAASPERA